MSGTLVSIGEIVVATGEPIHRVKYAIQSRRVKPVCRGGCARLFDEAGVAAIRKALTDTKRRQLSDQAKAA